MPPFRQHETVLDAAASFENVGILGVVVALANDVCRPELEFFRQRSRACPLYVFRVVVRARVLAAHYVDFVKPFGGATDACELVEISRSLVCEREAQT